jgi:hypothetical protein
MRWGVVCAAGLLLGGCAGMSYALEHYSGVEVIGVEMPDDTYRVFDKPAENRMMVTSSVAAALGQGAGRGLTLGAANTTPPKPRFQAAAEKHLADTGRTCRITDGYLIIEPQFEFRYDCTPVAPPAVEGRPATKRGKSS